MNDQNNIKREIKCPHCGRLTLYSTENLFRPFCSERCRTIDLGAWASETYKVPVTSSSALTSGIEDLENELEEGS